MTLDAGERARAQRMREKVLAEAPAAVGFIKELHQLGLIEGWRAVVAVGEPLDNRGWVTGPFQTGRELSGEKR